MNKNITSKLSNIQIKQSERNGEHIWENKNNKIKDVLI